MTAAAIKALEEQGVIEIRTEQMFRNPIPAAAKEKKCHTDRGAAKAVETFWQDYEQGRTGTYLVYGVTGSGKTEVYMEMIDRVLKRKQAIVLIPEIALTYQTVRRFYGWFGDKVSVLNSRLSQGERYDQFKRAKRGEIQIMVRPPFCSVYTFFQTGFDHH